MLVLQDSPQVLQDTLYMSGTNTSQINKAG